MSMPAWCEVIEESKRFVRIKSEHPIGVNRADDLYDSGLLVINQSPVMDGVGLFSKASLYWDVFCCKLGNYGNQKA